MRRPLHRQSRMEPPPQRSHSFAGDEEGGLRDLFTGKAGWSLPLNAHIRSLVTNTGEKTGELNSYK
ncbi:MAG: hypothetical protein ACE5J1_06140 [Nitrospiria bacterium]